MSEANALVKAVEFIKPFEGLRLEAYWDSIGEVWSIGFGHSGGVKPGEKITESFAEQLLKEDVQVAFDLVKRYATTVLNENQFASLISFEYNTGAGRASGVFSCVDRDEFSAAMTFLMEWVHDGQGNVVPGLVRRRMAERDLFMTPMPSA